MGGKMIKVIIIAEAPDGLVKSLMQHIRNFDIANPGCKFQMMVNAPGKSTVDITQMLEIQPPLTISVEGGGGGGGSPEKHWPHLAGKPKS
jgi:hypothetical protein